MLQCVNYKPDIQPVSTGLVTGRTSSVLKSAVQSQPNVGLRPVTHVTETGLTQPSILKWSVNEYWLRLGRFKAGMCDAAWCAPCT